MPTGWFRIVEDGPHDGATNMAVDEAILESHVEAPAPSGVTVRLYGWRPPALSLGRRQLAAGAHDPAFLAAEGIDLVRRPTGGRAVLHEHELTYAVAGTLGTAAFPGGVLDTYGRVAKALAEALRALGVDAVAAAPRRGSPRDPGPFGPPVCFDRAGAHEIAVGGRKLVGSAQLRRKGAFLQHGSILLRADPERLARAIGAEVDAASYTDLGTLLGRAADEGALRAAIVAAFEQALDVAAVSSRLTRKEDSLARRLRASKYGSAAWTLHGRC